MTLPNRLTVVRLVLVPVFFVWFFVPNFVSVFNVSAYSIVLALLYGVAELTDLLDGKIARKTGQVTELGKVMDPFGDVMSHLTYFVCLITCSLMPVWAFVVILWREFSQSFLRMLLMSKGKAMAANIFGKAKTCLYAAVCVCGFACRCAFLFGYVKAWMFSTMNILGALAALASALSFIVYLAGVKKGGLLKDLTR